MKLHCANYQSPIDTEGNYSDVYIEDVSYELRRSEKLFKVKFEMFHIKNDKRIKLDEAEISFRGSNEDQQNGLPTTNKTTVLRIPQSEDYTPATYDELGEIITEQIGYPEYNISMLKYLGLNEGIMPESYEVIEWGWATQEDAIKYFTGGELDAPELFIPSEFAKEWLKHNLQMKGEYISQFEFIA